MIGSCSIDTTCTIWDCVQMVPKTQLIAHDKEVYDIAFACGKDIFGTVGADGSLRMFDLRFVLMFFLFVFMSKSSFNTCHFLDLWNTPPSYMKLLIFLLYYASLGTNKTPIISRSFKRKATKPLSSMFGESIFVFFLILFLF
jgi:hypothetical protein